MKKYTIAALATALIVCLSLVILIPIPASNGFVTLADAGILTMSFLFGPQVGLAVGALSGGAIDLLSGYSQWIIFSALIHGLEGYLAGKAWQKSPRRRGLFAALAAIVMVLGYFVANFLLYHSLASALAGIPGNILQVGFGLLVALPLSNHLKTVVAHKYLSK